MGQIKKDIQGQVVYSSVAPHEENLFFWSTFSWTPGDPWTVTISFDPRYSNESWKLSREMLCDAVSRLPGQEEFGWGDVRMYRGINRVYITLRVNKHSISINFPTYALEAFLGSTYEVLPFGEESWVADWDAELAKILA